MKIFTLHGFLGSPQDWTQVFVKKKINAIDLFRLDISPFDEWAKNFNAYASKESASARILVGYSLGGRLALCALDQDPTLWDAAIIISANPGLTSDDAKEARIAHDERWARRFETEPWNELMDAWNGQGVLKGNRPMERNEKDYSRDVLAEALRTWSLGRQKNFFPRISEFSLPILWIAGERDSKFTALAQNVILKHPQSKLWIAPDAGHRVPWEQTEMFRNEIFTFLGEKL